MYPRPLPRLVKPTEEGAQLHPLAVIMVLSPFLLLIAAAVYVLATAIRDWTAERLVLSVFHPAIVLGLGGTVRILPSLVAGLRSKLDERRARSAAYWLTRIGAFIFVFMPLAAVVFFLFAGLGAVPFIPIGPHGLVLWLAAGSAVACIVGGQFFEKVAQALIQRSQAPRGSWQDGEA